MKKDDSQFLERTERYLQQFEPTNTHEKIFTEFAWKVKVFKKFERYLKKEKLQKRMPNKLKNHIERRRLFIEWYVNSHQDKTITQCVDDLERLCFVGYSTIYETLKGFR